MNEVAPENALVFDHVGFAATGRSILVGIDLAVPKGRITAMMGPSGAGKSIALAIAAGLLSPSSGQIRRAAQQPAIVFQDPRLLPWRSALDNVAFALKAARLTRRERRERAREMLLALGLDGADLTKFPQALSGGMRQRTALARALVIGPDLLLLDEPFVALDPGLAQQMQQRVVDYVDRRGASALVVTHSISEALRIADRVVVLSPGPGRVVMMRDVPKRPDPDIARAITDALHGD